MNKTQINERLELLFFVLQFSSQESPVFTSGQRIAINQECGTLRNKLIYPQTEIRKVSPEIEEKIKTTERLIHSYGWQPLNPERFDDSKRP